MYARVPMKQPGFWDSKTQPKRNPKGLVTGSSKDFAQTPMGLAHIGDHDVRSIVHLGTRFFFFFYSHTHTKKRDEEVASLGHVFWKQSLSNPISNSPGSYR